MVVRPLIAAATVALASLAVAAPAHAAPRVDVANADGEAAVDPRYNTRLTLRGSGFQSVKGGHGGLYVMFGTVQGAWQPSRGGGGSYVYIPDSEAKANAGYQRFVAFPGSDTAKDANGGTITADGTWSTTLTVPGATFKAVNRQGRTVSVDCRRSRCGVITIGAHGVRNARNESFTPVSVKALSRGAAQASGTAAAPGADTPTDGAAADEGPAAGGTRAKPVLKVDRATAVAGRALSFQAAGLRAGDQVTATLDDGVAAVGPLTVSARGTLAGVLALPAGLGAGTHTLRLTGLAKAPSLNFAVTSAAPAVAPASASAAPAAADGGGRAAVAFAVVAGLVLLASLAATVLRLARRGGTRAAA